MIERDRLEAEQSSLLDQEIRLTEAFTSGDISPDVYKPQAADLRARRADVLANLGKPDLNREALLGQVDDMLRLATCCADLFDQLSEPRRVELIQAVFKSIVLGAEGVVGFTLKPPFDVFTRATLKPAATVDERDLAKAILSSDLGSPSTAVQERIGWPT